MVNDYLAYLHTPPDSEMWADYSIDLSGPSLPGDRRIPQFLFAQLVGTACDGWRRLVLPQRFFPWKMFSLVDAHHAA
eukprot:7012899-Alexandrium_andersonii.AAC.1